ncbi:MAG: M23 family metallopeptidase, partial [Bacteroidota bacterium]
MNKRFLPKIFYFFSLTFFLFLTLSWKYFNSKATGESVESVRNFDFSLPFIWPTDASKIVTNEFGAFRKTHFHEGIDISTNRRTGYKVYAVLSGYVSRIRVSPNGYGKQLTMKHDDGTSSSFSHLSRFCDAIERAVKREQHRAGGYEIDFATENSALHFAQGDVVAFTGETGAGPPHLHFEVYDNNMNPVNPLLIETYKFDEFTPPIFGRMTLMPMTSRSRVDGERKNKIFSTKKKNRSEYIVAQPIKISGDIGIAIYTEDVPDDERRLTGVYRLQLLVDDTLYYEAKFDSLQYGGSKQIALHYDYTGMKYRGAKFQKLFVDDGNRLPLYIAQHQSKGVISTEMLSPGQHQFKIVSMDLAGNAATVTGTFISNHTPVFTNYKLNGNTLSFSIENESAVKKIILSSKKSINAEWHNKEILLSKIESRITPSRRKEYVVQIADKNFQSIKLVGSTTAGTNSFPVFIIKDAPKSLNSSVDISYELFRNEIVFSIKANAIITSKPTLSVKEGSKVQSVSLHAIDMKKYEGSYKPSTIFIGERIVTLRADIAGKEY